MREEVDFLFDNQLIAALEKLIRDSKKCLLLVSPYIDLDARIMDALAEKKSLPDFHLLVLFGKNEGNYQRSMKRDSMAFLKEFPNAEIRYNERLHAKFYQNDYEYIMTSLNLYDFSLANNIEVGIRSEFATRGIMGKALDITADLVADGIGKVKHDVMGVERDVNPREKFQQIFEASELVYKTTARVSNSGLFSSITGKKKLDSFEVVVDKLNIVEKTKPEMNLTEIKTTTITSTVQTITTEVKYLSASQIARNYGLQTRDVSNRMQALGLISEDRITDMGVSKGLVMKSYMGNKYVAYPDNLEELKQLTNSNCN